MADFRIRTADDPPSFLALLIDTDAGSWITSRTGARSPDEACRALENVVEQVLVFLNTFLLLHQQNRAAVIVVGRHGLKVAYPRFSDAEKAARDPEAADAEDDAFHPASTGGSAAAAGDPDAVLRDIRDAVAVAVAEAMTAQAQPCNQVRSPLVSAALATALCLINRRRLRRVAKVGVRETDGNNAEAVTESVRHAALDGEARILTVLAGCDTPEQYVPVMNCIFSAQRMNVPIDTCMLHPTRDSTFFQQAAHLTKGVYLRPQMFSAEAPESLQQYLMTAFLADAQCRDFLSMPLQGEVDFRASCFVTRKPISEGYTCSVCLSTFELSIGRRSISCPTCHARFATAIAKPAQPVRPRLPASVGQAGKTA
jgi:transcription initiation factor TFIIH subunit 3